MKTKRNLKKMVTIFYVTLGFGTISAFAQEDVLSEAEKLNTGMNKEVYLYVTEPVVSFDEVAKILPDHMDFVHKIENQGTMIMGGQTTIEGADNAGGYGAIMIRANSFEEARRIADQDPMHKTGVRKYTLYKWNINEGEMNVRLKLSDASFTID
ncbi:MAG: YciI family protein [Bacteroidota bacterium]|nr:YciI family protein [uncultured Allomuricauda sp.]